MENYVKDALEEALVSDEGSSLEEACLIQSFMGEVNAGSDVGEAVGWEDKRSISEDRIEELNKHIERYQPGENEIYLTHAEKECVGTRHLHRAQ